MDVAFYAPLKPPDHPVPSGDRTMARALLALLSECGHRPITVSRFRSFDRAGDPARQERLARLGASLAERLARRISTGLSPRPALWLTYHLYHKAPDHLGPRVVERFDLPYLVIEASCARRQADGPWALGHAASLRALARADLLLAMSERDRSGLLEAGLPEDAVRLFPPFLDAAPLRAAAIVRPRHRAALARALALDPAVPWILVVAMMRPGAKRRSYALSARALSLLTDRPWALLVAGDGPLRPAVEAELAAACGPRLRLLGRCAPEDLAVLYAACDFFFWPAVEEAYGMALLEAQAAGLPVVAGREGGVDAVVADGKTGFLVRPRDAGALAAAARLLLDAPELRARLGRAAAARVAREHDRPVARTRLEAAIAEACGRRARARSAAA
ncbi:MAG: glycosyltransferase family 4 protein [Geminicoccaceae bacterium]|nr:glycosyltransferase family 4 protein [Geminicoccaceae bacterium]MDW8124539.1 glycosyltransferase family 4 protein [Geminicoccaceae bacterium]